MMAQTSDTDALETLVAAGFARIDVPVLLGMDDFVRISGEEFRRRIFMTTDNRGNDYCLRPEFTIPVAREAVSDGKSGGRYCYSGRIFLNGTAGEAMEEWQLGAEIIGAHDVAATDREALALALGTLKKLVVTPPAVRIGDIGLFRALLASLGVPAAWARRLTLAYGNAHKVNQTLDQMADQSTTFSGLRAHPDVVAALAQLRAEAVGDLFAEVLSIAGVKTVGGRTPAEIAERVVEQATLAAEGVIPETSIAIIRELLAIEGPIDAGIVALERIATRLDGAECTALDLFKRRRAGLAEGATAAKLVFSGSFGRELGYYDGFVFDLIAANGAVIAGGGRYDDTASRLAGRDGVRAVGFAIFPGRI